MTTSLNLAQSQAPYTLVPPLVGEHPLVQELRGLIERVAPSDSTVLLTGESGTGKEVAARTIHARSARRARPFVAVNCAAIPLEMLESELFGHERGAFTGAVVSRSGLLRAAQGGTVLLDEITELPAPLQAKLLRVLEEHEVRPLGADYPTRLAVRIIAATNQDLDAAVRKGVFRRDLFYRLRVIPIVVPPLRERRSDIPALIQHFARRLDACPAGRELTFDSDAMVRLWSYDWPGNVRELAHLVERLAIIHGGGPIGAAMLPPEVTTGCESSDAAVPAEWVEQGIDLHSMVREFEGRLINQALHRVGGNKQAAARLLGLKRTTLGAKLRRFGKAPKTFSNSSR